MTLQQHGLLHYLRFALPFLRHYIAAAARRKHQKQLADKFQQPSDQTNQTLQKKRSQTGREIEKPLCLTNLEKVLGAIIINLGASDEIECILVDHIENVSTLRIWAK